MESGREELASEIVRVVGDLVFKKKKKFALLKKKKVVLK